MLGSFSCAASVYNVTSITTCGEHQPKLSCPLFLITLFFITHAGHPAGVCWNILNYHSTCCSLTASQHELSITTALRNRVILNDNWREQMQAPTAPAGGAGTNVAVLTNVSRVRRDSAQPINGASPITAPILITAPIAMTALLPISTYGSITWLQYVRFTSLHVQA